MNRACYNCNREIKECMGYVLARDFINFQINSNQKIRELCGLCVFKLEEKIDEFNPDKRLCVNSL